MGLLAITHRKGAGASPLRATLLSLLPTLCLHKLSDCSHAAFGAAYISFAMATYCHQQACTLLQDAGILQGTGLSHMVSESFFSVLVAYGLDT